MPGVYLLLFLVLAATTSAYPEVDSPFPQPRTFINTRADADRLPTSVVPLKYNVKLVPFITEGNFTFDGEVLITVQATDATTNITLHSLMLTIDQASIVVTDITFGDTVEVTGIEVVPEYDFYVIQLATPLRANLQYTVQIKKFTGILADDLLGFYRSSYVESGVRRWLATTQLEGSYARRVFPCFDEPALKSLITVSISRTADLRAISNMPQDGPPVLDTKHTDELRYWDNFLETPMMSIYLVAIVVSDFVYLENAAESFRIFAQPQMISQARYSLSVSPPILNWLGEYTGIDFQLPKMDEVAIPDFAFGAMENWGLVIYRERYLLFQEGVTTSPYKQLNAAVIAHEYAHQWFGNLVTCDWWNYTWLNEGFATYFEFFTTAGVETTWRMDEQFIITNNQIALVVDGSESSRPMTWWPESAADVDTTNGRIDYAKSGAVIRMMEHMISSTIFQRGIRRYLTERSYKSAVADDLFSNMNAQYHEDNSEADFDVKTVMDTWTLQMGYPVVTVTRDYAGNSAQLTQERFLYVVDPESPDTHDYRWHIPLTYTTQGAPDFESTSTMAWFNVEDETITLDNMPQDTEWVLFNIKEIGFYRVNYDAQNWALLTSQLNSEQYDDIHLMNRAQLVDDSFNLARAGVLSYDTSLTLSQYLTRDTDYVVWMAAFNAFNFIDMKLTFSTDYATFQDFILTLMNGVYSSVGLEEGADDGHVLKLNRGAAVSWACNMGAQDCIDTSIANFAAWMATGTNPITPDLKQAMYCTALRNGGAAEYDFLYQQYMDSKVASEFPLILSLLGCTYDQDSLNALMRAAITEDSGIRRQDSGAAFGSVTANPGAFDTAIDFITTNFQDIATYYRSMGQVGSLLNNIASRSIKQEHADKMQVFLDENSAELGSTAASVQAAISTIATNQQWVDTHGQDILDWINNNTIKKQ